MFDDRSADDRFEARRLDCETMRDNNENARRAQRSPRHGCVSESGSTLERLSARLDASTGYSSTPVANETRRRRERQSLARHPAGRCTSSGEHHPDDRRMSARDDTRHTERVNRAICKEIWGATRPRVLAPPTSRPSRLVVRELASWATRDRRWDQMTALSATRKLARGSAEITLPSRLLSACGELLL